MNTDKQVKNGQKSADNYPTDSNSQKDSNPADCHRPKDNSRYSRSDVRPRKDGPGGENAD